MTTQEQTDAFLSALGAEMESWRKRRNLTRLDVARLSDTSEKLVGRYERGEVVKVRECLAIAAALRVPLSEMVRRVEDALDIDTRGEARRRQAG
jgi:transcriptional regulator with XRE-family HTH domain